MNDIYLIMRRTHKEAIAHARASGLNVLLQFHSAESFLRSERNPAYALTYFCCLEADKGRRGPNVIGHFDRHLRLLC